MKKAAKTEQDELTILQEQDRMKPLTVREPQRETGSNASTAS